MNVNICKDVNEFDNNEGIVNNKCEMKLPMNNFKECYSSEELFSDDDQHKHTVLDMSAIFSKNDCISSSVTLTKTTPILYSKEAEEACGKASVPKTPTDLKPFIKKTSILWTSAMETPERKLINNDQICIENCDNTLKESEINNTPNRLKHSINYNEMKTSKSDITSPVLGGKKRSKRKVKRRILQQTELILENNDVPQNNISSNSDKVLELTGLKCSSTILNIRSENKILLNKDIKESNNEEGTLASERNINTSTQDFFSNASFSIIDQLCSVIQKEKQCTISEIKTCSADKGECKKYTKTIYDEINNEKIKSKENISNDILERVAIIKQNQKPLRRSTDINCTIIPKEIFSKSVLELELADIKANEDRKKVANIPVNLCQSSFTKFSCMENDFVDSIKQLFVKENEINSLSNEIPNDIMNEWNLDNILDNQTENNTQLNEIKHEPNNYSSLDKEKCKNIPLEEKLQNEIHINNNLLNVKENLIIENDIIETNLLHSESNISLMTDGFSTARGKAIAVNSDKVLKYAKIYSEIEKENLNDNTFFKLKNDNSKVNKKFEKSNFVNHPTTKFKARENNFSISFEQTHNKVEKSKILKLYQDLESEEFVKLNPNSTENEENNSNDKITNENQICYESHNNEDKSAILKSNDNNNIEINDLTAENEKHIAEKETILFSNLISNNGFSTANGKNIKINKEKENYYSKIYAKLNDDVMDESSLLKTKTNLTATSNNNKKINKNLVVFNKDKNLEKMANIKKNIGDIQFLPADNPIQLSSIESNTNGEILVKNSKNDTLINTKMELSAELKSSLKNYEDIKSLENFNILKNIADDCPAKKFKRKLQCCEIKKPERCRSFGGFPVISNSTSTVKLNKSDSNDDSVANHSLLKGMSVSQCFDSFSDSLLSKVEISHLNTSKSKILEPKIVIQDEKSVKQASIQNINCILEETDQFFGFSFQDCTESFRNQRNFEKIVNKLNLEYRNSIEVGIEIGESISLSNETSSKQNLVIKYGNNLDLKKCIDKYSYELTESQAKKIEYKVKNNCLLSAAENVSKKIKLENMVGKRKYTDSDSDNTPLTILKKPRIGSELQGRKLFYDESDAEENATNIIENVENQTSLFPKNIQRIIFEEENDLSEERLNAILIQEKLIRNKKRIKIKPIMGTLLRQRLINSKKRIPWANLVGDSVPKPRNITQILENCADVNILRITASNATCYKFLSTDIVKNKRIISFDVGDGGLLIFDENGYAGVSEFTNSFLAMPGVDPKLIPTGWIENHYKWIIWKLASLDRIYFKSIQFKKMLTPERVMQELKYRYDREIDKAQRPCLRRILEKDDNPTRRLILCICLITENSNDEETNKEMKGILGLPRWRIEATDGWYSIPLTIDNIMSKYISNGKIREGTKIVTYGAELLDCERGFFPLERPANVSLKIHTNCTRRAKWDSKLGYQKCSRPISIKLRDIIANGGMVGETTGVAARVYPLLYREKTADGQSIFRNAKSEEKAADAYECMLESKVNAMYAIAQKNFESKKSSEIDLDAWEEVHKQNKYKQEEIKQEIVSEIRQDLPPPRQVTTVQKVRLFDKKTTVILTIWGSGDFDDSAYNIKEGSTITVINSFAIHSRGGELNLTANRFTHLKREPLLKLPYPLRACTLIPDLNLQDFKPNFNEFDTVGVVVSSGPAPYGMKNFEMVNLAYPKPNSSESSYLSILFWNGVLSFGYKGMLTEGAFVSCSNLEWRRNTKWSIAVAYCSERTLFTCNPRQLYLNQEFQKLKTLIQNPKTYAESCVKEVANELSKKPVSRSNQGTPSNWADRSSLCNTSSMNSPLDNYTPNKAMIHRRLEKLSRYGVVNEASPIVLNNSSSKVNKGFTPVAPKGS